MVDSPAPDDLVIQSHRGPYRVRFAPRALSRLSGGARTVAVVDARVAELYGEDLAPVLERPSTLPIVATEQSKSLERFPDYVEHLVRHGIRRGDVLVAIGGGILQDITCFLATTLLRGLEWRFVPTTLLAQADSCIGSKSSINVRAIKNVLGTFTPPAAVEIDVSLLATLHDRDIRSGIGEMLKVHAIAGPEAFDAIAADYPALFAYPDVLARYIRRSLELKRRLIELDEFDRGPRNVMNYGHSFGHAIESATDFAVPHGIAVTIGMDMANHVALALERTTAEHVARMRPVLTVNFSGYEDAAIPFEAFIDALAKDKKNSARTLRLVLPDERGTVALCDQPPDDRFREACREYLSYWRTR